MPYALNVYDASLTQKFTPSGPDIVQPPLFDLAPIRSEMGRDGDYLFLVNVASPARCTAVAMTAEYPSHKLAYVKCYATEDCKFSPNAHITRAIRVSPKQSHRPNQACRMMHSC